jgi:receptor-binding and translocation channel-forming TcA subunit of Tc toxin
MATTHLENFYAIRHRYPLSTERAGGRLGVAAPATSLELSYRDLLSEANSNFFHREYQIALQNYQDLRNKILVQSDPDMPSVPGGGGVFDIDISKVDWKRIAELGRYQLEKAPLDGPISFPLADQPVIEKDGFTPTPGTAKFKDIGISINQPLTRVPSTVRDFARTLAASGDVEGAGAAYEEAATLATDAGDKRLSAEILAESGAMAATLAGPGEDAGIETAFSTLTRARDAFASIQDEAAVKVIDENLKNLAGMSGGFEAGPAGSGPRISDTGPGLSPTIIGGGTRTSTPTTALAGPRVVVLEPEVMSFSVPAGDLVLDATTVLHEAAATAVQQRTVGLYLNDAVISLPVERDAYLSALEADVYSKRITASNLNSIWFYEQVDTNFVAYIPQLFFFVLPIAIGDTYAAMGMYQQALDEYAKALAYPFLNSGIEAPYIWLKMAKAALDWGDRLFRQGSPEDARAQYEKLIGTDLSVPAGSPLYQGALASIRDAATETAKEIQGQAHAEVNPKVAELVTRAYLQLQRIANGLNFYGLGPDDYPVFRFKYLQAVANYMADNAVQTERTFISFRSTAENQTLERIQLENAVDVNKAALAVEQKRLEDAQLEVEAAAETRHLAELRRAHAQDSLDDWNTLGRELASVNAALAWASNASNDQDITYTGVRYNGERHDFDTNVEEFYDVVGEWRENLNFEIQQRRLERAISEADDELTITKTREAQARVRQQAQELSIMVAEKRLEGAQDMLDFATDRTFDEDLWFKLAAELQDLSRQYLDMATYAGLVMERAYELEFDRRLGRIRQDYGIGGMEGLLGGDYLKRDIAEFTFDYLQNAQRKNPVRVTISLRDEFPQSFDTFSREGIMAFTTDLEIFDRLYPGTYRRKLKKVELFVEGLIPLEGISGLLTHSGVSTEWRNDGGWTKHSRVIPAQRMVLSSYEFRRDYTVFQPSEELLELFENLGPQANWTLEVPRSSNNLDYQAISDVKLVLYFDADHDESLRTHIKALYPNDGGRSLVLSSRFHFPDQYFRMELDRQVAFELHPTRFAYNETDQKLNGFGVRLLSKTGGVVPGADLSITRASDGSHVDGTTDAKGVIAGIPPTMAPFTAWNGDPPIDTFTVAFADGVDISTVADVQLFIDYAFTYRADGSL